VLLELSPEQEFLAETTAKFLAATVPTGELRRRRDDGAGFDAAYWRKGAELGWTSLLVAERAGGGSVSGRGVVDLALLSYEFGRAAAPGPLVGANVVAAALSDTGTHPDVLAGLLDGSTLATWAVGEPPPSDHPGDINTDIQVDGGTVVVNGVKRPVESALQADHFLVTGRTGDGLTQVLVPRHTPGVIVEPMTSVDLTRRFGVVQCDDVRLPPDAIVGAVGTADAPVERQLQLAMAILNAECVGAMQRVFDMTLEWAFDRYTFGRPLASYQELKHRFADMKAWLEASHAISDVAADAVQDARADAGELVSIAKAYIGHYGTELVHDCVQLHGGIGVTYEHDIHLFVRRVTLDRSLFGTPADHRQRIASFVEERV
jgi:alkylation response protein AidB-like acyl-CoA dehydrogenase